MGSIFTMLWVGTSLVNKFLKTETVLVSWNNYLYCKLTKRCWPPRLAGVWSGCGAWSTCSASSDIKSPNLDGFHEP